MQIKKKLGLMGVRLSLLRQCAKYQKLFFYPFELVCSLA